MIVDAQRRALAEVGATDAVALIVDELVLFEDHDRRPDDLGDLLLAFHEYAPAIASEVRVLRLVVEHLEAGVHYVIELQARTEYPRGESPIRVIVSGRLAALQARQGETAEVYRARVEPLVNDQVGFQIAQVSFDDFVSRLRDAIARAMPDAHASVAMAAPAAQPADIAPRQRVQRSDDAAYDPHEAHYPNPMLGMVGLAMLGGFMAPGFAAAAALQNDGDPRGTDGTSSDRADAGVCEADDGGGFDLEW